MTYDKQAAKTRRSELGGALAAMAMMFGGLSNVGFWSDRTPRRLERGKPSLDAPSPPPAYDVAAAQAALKASAPKKKSRAQRRARAN